MSDRGAIAQRTTVDGPTLKPTWTPLAVATLAQRTTVDGPALRPTWTPVSLGSIASFAIGETYSATEGEALYESPTHVRILFPLPGGTAPGFAIPQARLPGIVATSPRPR